MGMCKVSGGITKHYDRKLRKDGPPNSKAELYKKGKLKQERWFDSDGHVYCNRDWDHKWDPRHGEPKFPHDHYWENGRRSKEHFDPDWSIC